MEIQLIHIQNSHKDILDINTGENYKKKLAILSILVELQKLDNNRFKNIFNVASQLQSKNDSKTVTGATKLTNFLPRNTDKFYRYMDCDDTVTWTIFKVIIVCHGESFS